MLCLLRGKRQIASFLFVSAVLGAVLTGCDKPSNDVNAIQPESISAVLPKPFARLNNLKLTSSNFSVKAIIDGSSYEVTDLVIDQTKNTISGKIEGVPKGNRSIQLEYYVNDIRVAATAIFDVNVEGGKQNTADIDTDQLSLDDSDGDGFSNLSELDAGTDLNDARQAPVGAKPNVLPPAPTNLIATALDRTVKLSWQLEGFAASYNVYYSTNEQDPNNINKAQLTVLEDAKSPFIIPDDLTNQTEYHFYIASINSVGESIAHIAATPDTPQLPAPPTNMKTIENKIVWDDVANAREYDIYFSQSPLTIDNYLLESIARETVSSNELHIPSTFIINTKYYFYVIAKNSSGNSAPGDVGEVTTTIGVPQIVGNITATVNSNIVNVTWDSISDLNYTIYIAQESLNAGNLQSANGLIKLENQNSPVSINNLEAGAPNYIVVTASNEIGESSPSESFEVTLTAFPAPTKPKVTATSGNFNLQWNDNSNAQSYSVYMAMESGVKASNADSLSGGMTHSNVIAPFGHTIPNETTYYMVVTSSDSSDKESVESTEVSVKPKAIVDGVPEEISIEADEDQITLNWKAVAGAQSYNVYWSTTPDFTPQTGQRVPGGSDITSTNITHTGLQNGVMHYYVVTAINADAESEQSAQVGAIPYGILPKPINITTTEGDQNITLQWPPVASAVKYHLYMAPDKNLTIANAASLTDAMIHKDNIASPFNHAGLINDTNYFFLITAVDQFGRESAASELVQAAPHGISQVNQNPILDNKIPDQIATAGTKFNFQFNSNTFSDPDQDALSYSASVSDSVLPAWLSFNGITRSFNGIPASSDVAVLDIKVIAEDGNGGSISTTFKLSVNNPPGNPVAINDGPVTALEGGEIVINVLDNDVITNSSINLKAVTITSPAAHGNTTLNNDGTITYVHDGSETTEDSFSYQFADNEAKTSNSAKVTINVTPQNDAPSINGSPDTAASAGSLYNFTPDASDPDSVELAFSISNKPDWAEFDTTNGKLSGTPNNTGTYPNILISVSDGKASTSLPEFLISVSGSSPVAKNDTAEVIAIGNSVNVNILANDTDSDGTIDPSTVTIKSSPANGSVKLNAGGSVTYQSTPGTLPGDSFTYTVKDNNGLESNIATVTINVKAWTSTDVGNIGTAKGSMVAGSGEITVAGAGADIWGSADAFHFAYKQISGDIDFVVRVKELQNTKKWIKAGIMIRESLTAESKHVNLFVTDPGFLAVSLHGVHFQSRIADAGLTGEYTNRFNGTGSETPQYIRLTRRDNTFNAFESEDGVSWKHVGTLNLPMNNSVYVGMAVTSHTDGVVSTAIYDNFSLLNKTIDTPSFTTVSNKTLVNQTVGTDSVYYRVSGLNFGKTYTVDLQSNAGEDLNLQVYHDPFNVIECQSYLIGVDYDACQATANTSDELYIKVDGSYTSTGAKFSLKLTEWTAQDIGTQTSGYDSETDYLFPENDVYTVAGSGKDIYGSSDGFHYFYQHASGDVEIIAHVINQQETHEWAKAGVMLRANLDTNSHFVDAVRTPNWGVRFQSRKSQGFTVDHDNTRINRNSDTQRWVRLVKRGTAFDAYESTNGTKWLFLGTTNLPGFPSSFLAGLAVSAHDDLSDLQISEANFDNLRIYNSAGSVIIPEVMAGPISTAQANSFYVDATTDRFFKITGLPKDPTTVYTLNLDGMTDNADMYVYSDAFETPVCPASIVNTNDTVLKEGTTKETCMVRGNSNGEIYVRINASYTNFGSTFTLTAE